MSLLPLLLHLELVTGDCRLQSLMGGHALRASDVRLDLGLCRGVFANGERVLPKVSGLKLDFADSILFFLILRRKHRDLKLCWSSSDRCIGSLSLGNVDER